MRKSRPTFHAGPNPEFSGYKVPYREVKAQNLGDGVGCPDSGTCEGCRQWDSELKDGYCADCRTPDARIRRAKEAIQQGQVKGLVLVEDMGKAGLFLGRGNKLR